MKQILSFKHVCVLQFSEFAIFKYILCSNRKWE